MSADLPVTQMVIQKCSSNGSVNRRDPSYANILFRFRGRIKKAMANMTAFEQNTHANFIAPLLVQFWIIIWITCGSVDESHWNGHHVITILLYQCVWLVFELCERDLPICAKNGNTRGWSWLRPSESYDFSCWRFFWKTKDNCFLSLDTRSAPNKRVHN